MTGLAEAWLRPFAPGQEPTLAEALAALGREILAAEAVPAAEFEAADATSRGLVGFLLAQQSAPPLPAHRRPLQAEAPLFATLPIAAEQRVGEAPSIRGALRFQIVTTQQEMERRFDPLAVARSLIETAAPPAPAVLAGG